jgi:hypothetical protein
MQSLCVAHPTMEALAAACLGEHGDSKDGVEATLVPLSLAFEPFQNICIDANGQLSFDWAIELPLNSTNPILGRSRRQIGEVDVLLGPSRES